ncbi:peptide deformylase [Desulfurella multipotens]|uniref:Peptide deformylase n=1 Tax=Desulfurella multipotens TaxID=79269 RepID=A0A1G6LFM8_9BACT|nr:peptide deformylase [Desulfurella multipotens]SDC42039.1 peptide deformylase [Desulfurella multipotens]
MIEIVKFPDKLLKKQSLYVDTINSEVLSIIDKLTFVLDFYNHCVGIAAVQIGHLVRIVAVDVSKTKNKNHGRLIMINPVVIEKSTDEIVTKEGCLSVPDYLGYVARPKKITVEYVDLNGKRQVLEAKRFEAVVIQHEVDHLDGILFLDKIVSSNQLIKRL